MPELKLRVGVAGRGGSIAKRALAASPATASALSR